jgi:large subunit ribosomal protein L29
MMKKKDDIQAKSEAELHARVLFLDREIFALRSELAMNRKLDKPHLIKARRKDKARILTILTQKQLSRGVHGVSK